MKKVVGSGVGSGSGSISQRYGSGEPDPHQNVTDPQHCSGHKAITAVTETGLSSVHRFRTIPVLTFNNIVCPGDTLSKLYVPHFVVSVRHF